MAMDYREVAKVRIRLILTNPEGDTLGVLPDILEPFEGDPHNLQLLLFSLLAEFPEQIDYEKLLGALALKESEKLARR